MTRARAIGHRFGAEDSCCVSRLTGCNVADDVGQDNCRRDFQTRRPRLDGGHGRELGTLTPDPALGRIAAQAVPAV